MRIFTPWYERPDHKHRWGTGERIEVWKSSPVTGVPGPYSYQKTCKCGAKDSLIEKTGFGYQIDANEIQMEQSPLAYGIDEKGEIIKYNLTLVPLKTPIKFVMGGIGTAPVVPGTVTHGYQFTAGSADPKEYYYTPDNGVYDV